MNEQNGSLELIVGEQRRRFLRLAGSAAALLPIVAITGCGSDAPQTPPAAASPSSPAEQDAQPERALETAPEPAADVASQALPELELDNPTARALGYQHDANLIDAQQYPQRQPSHLCSNCALYSGREGDEWGPCSLFPGKAVNAGGWCTAWAPRGSG
ncbi:MAG: high-potential iron-sulfur protein [Wenzhouxiangella sp.]|nr:high-potential iron-sulfur protein [Wenzhouxiangella sp.]MCH8477585.1 high-potential iron-sulfur protein [Wenzhouxiangella sp.]TVR97187.1 MAG: hypothetical protein EA418_03920 [Wenzhouxiangellaceae bacterium]